MLTSKILEAKCFLLPSKHRQNGKIYFLKIPTKHHRKRSLRALSGIMFQAAEEFIDSDPHQILGRLDFVENTPQLYLKPH